MLVFPDYPSGTDKVFCIVCMNQGHCVPVAPESTKSNYFLQQELNRVR
jgi:hypothetical protein